MRSFEEVRAEASFAKPYKNWPLYFSVCKVKCEASVMAVFPMLKYHAMKTYGGAEVNHAFLILALYGGE
jgi:hypothetical protein